jgi:predicted XRE-type DNA-binding protein
MARNFNELRERMSPDRRASNQARAKAAIAAMPMEQLREAREMTQVQLSEILHVTQGAVSKVERRTDMYISTLRSYVRAMGGDVQIRAIFPEGQEVILNQFSDLDL